MKEHTTIEFRRERDFGEVVNVTFHFLRAELLPLGKSLLYIIGPAALMLGLAASAFSMVDTSLESGEELEQFFNTGGVALFVYFLILIVLQPVVYVLAVLVVNGYIILHQERPERSIDVSEIWVIVKSRFGEMLGVTLILGFYLVGWYLLALVVSVILIGVPVAIFDGASGADGWVSVAFGVLFAMFGFLVAFGLLIYRAVIYSLVFPVKMHESIPFGEALDKAKYLIEGKWWSTFLVIFVSTIIMYILGFVFNVPQFVLSLLSELHMVGPEGEQPWYLYPLFVFSVVGSLGSTLLTCIPMAATALQYFALSEEKEKLGLRQRIERIGAGEETGPFPQQE